MKDGEYKQHSSRGDVVALVVMCRALMLSVSWRTCWSSALGLLFVLFAVYAYSVVHSKFLAVALLPEHCRRCRLMRAFRSAFPSRLPWCAGRLLRSALRLL